MILTPLFKSLSVLTVLAAAAALLAFASTEPGELTLDFQGWHISTTAATGLGILLVAAGIIFYLGQTVSWLLSLSSLLENRRTRNTLETLTKAQASWLTGDDAGTTALLASLKNTAETETMATLWAQMMKPNGATLNTLKNHPTLGAWAHLMLAQHAAAKGQWEACETQAEEGQKTHKQTTPGGTLSPHLLTLQFKAQLNQNKLAEAGDTLQSLTPFLNPKCIPLLHLLTGTPEGETTTAGLGHPWLKKFKTALQTPNPTLPAYEE